MCHSLLGVMATFSTAFEELSLVLLTHKHMNTIRQNTALTKPQKVSKCRLPQPVSVPACWTPVSFLCPPYLSCCLAASHTHHQPCFSARRISTHKNKDKQAGACVNTAESLGLSHFTASEYFTCCGNANVFRMADLHPKWASPVLDRANHARP